jgi:hypothetical protein
MEPAQALVGRGNLVGDGSLVGAETLSGAQSGTQYGSLAPRRVGMTAGVFQVPCAVCGVVPTTVLIEWQPAGSGNTCFGPAPTEWWYFCADHQIAADRWCPAT